MSSAISYVNLTWNDLYATDVCLSAIDFLEVNTVDELAVYTGEGWIHGMNTFNKVGALRVNFINPYKVETALTVVDRLKEKPGVKLLKENPDVGSISFTLGQEVGCVLEFTLWLSKEFKSALCRCAMSTFER